MSSVLQQAPKRMTLSRLSAGGLNARANAPGPAGGEKKRISASGRASLGRASLAPANATVAKRITDPRNISDRAYINGEIKNLIAYLLENGYNMAISPKTLLAPSLKDFRHLLEFLLRQLDPNFVFGAKFEEEVPLVFKRLGYPFTISKSALISVGSPHGWPHLLAALSWLVEVLNYAKDAQVVVEDNELADNNGEKMFYNYLVNAYGVYMAGNDDECEQLENELRGTFAERNDEISARINEVDARNKEMKEEIHRIKTSKTPLEILKATTTDLTNDIEKFNKFNANLVSHLQHIKKKFVEKQAEFEKQKIELADLQAEKAGIEDILSKQEITTEDVERIHNEKLYLENIYNTLIAEKKTKIATMNTILGDLTKKWSEIELVKSTINERLLNLNMIPSTSKFAQGKDLEIQLPVFGTATSGPSEVPGAASLIPSFTVNSILEIVETLKTAHRPLLDSVNSHYVNKHHNYSVEMIQRNERLSAVTETVRERNAVLGQLGDRLSKVEHKIKEETNREEDRISSMSQELVAVENAILALKERTNESVKQSNEEYNALKDYSSELLRAQEDEKNRVNVLVLNQLDIITQYKNWVTETLNEGVNRVGQYLNEVNEM